MKKSIRYAMLFVVTMILIKQNAALTDCVDEPPICFGGLLPQTATPAAINDYMLLHNTEGCRFIQPPKCPLNYKRKCIQECTP